WSRPVHEAPDSRPRPPAPPRPRSGVRAAPRSVVAVARGAARAGPREGGERARGADPAEPGLRDPAAGGGERHARLPAVAPRLLQEGASGALVLGRRSDRRLPARPARDPRVARVAPGPPPRRARALRRAFGPERFGRRER